MKISTKREKIKCNKVSKSNKFCKKDIYFSLKFISMIPKFAFAKCNKPNKEKEII